MIDAEGGYLIEFPDLPGCYAQAELVDDIPRLAEKARTAWIRSSWEAGDEIPAPTEATTYSGRLLLRLSPSLHRSLAESAEHEGISLNQYMVTLLAQRDAQARIEAKLDALLAAPSRQRKPARIAS
jgi:predicted HicB family RNase H-like nuclease